MNFDINVDDAYIASTEAQVGGISTYGIRISKTKGKLKSRPSLRV